VEGLLDLLLAPITVYVDSEHQSLQRGRKTSRKNNRTEGFQETTRNIRTAARRRGTGTHAANTSKAASACPGEKMAAKNKRIQQSSHTCTLRTSSLLILELELEQHLYWLNATPKAQHKRLQIWCPSSQIRQRGTRRELI
jgi:hypothetical protein